MPGTRENETKDIGGWRENLSTQNYLLYEQNNTSSDFFKIYTFKPHYPHAL
jgi:hypothetical protein